ncbi:MAG: hypothetical protein M3Q07_26865, partial [Pseudobdellovibrionaceae bacterium]|nr:hypothetical protein [Pseudobdellovibrionaceae bacterium]
KPQRSPARPGVERMSGVLLDGTVILFPEYLQEIHSVSYNVPASTRHHLITGLKPGASYGVERQNQDGSLTVTLKTGGTLQADEGGTLWFE